MTIDVFASSRTAGCPSAERKILTTPTGGASPTFAPLGVESPLAQLRQPGRADLLKRRRKVRDDFLGREGKPLQSPSRKGRRQTLDRCLVRPARGVDASFQNEALAAVSRASSSNRDEKAELFQSPSGVRPLDFRDHIDVRRRFWALKSKANGGHSRGRPFEGATAKWKLSLFGKRHPLTR